MKIVQAQSAVVSAMMDMKPHLCLSETDLPAVKRWKVGNTYTVVLDIKQVGSHLMDKRISADFEVESVRMEEAD